MLLSVNGKVAYIEMKKLNFKLTLYKLGNTLIVKYKRPSVLIGFQYRVNFYLSATLISRNFGNQMVKLVLVIVKAQVYLCKYCMLMAQPLLV